MGRNENYWFNIFLSFEICVNAVNYLLSKLSLLIIFVQFQIEITKINFEFEENYLSICPH